MDKLKLALWTAQRSTPDDLRKDGLMVAVHNDYRLNGKSMTFWLLTYTLPYEEQELRNFRTIAFKGEGESDQEALDIIRAAWANYNLKSG